jgi:hypothetical protein
MNYSEHCIVISNRRDALTKDQKYINKAQICFKEECWIDTIQCQQPSTLNYP